MDATLNGLAEALENGRVSARDLVEQSLERIADPNGEGERAFVAVHADAARADADYIDGLRKAGRCGSRFAGIPFSVKDLFDLAGEVTRAGSKVLDDAAPAATDAVAIARLKAAGFIPVGRTNMTEFAYSGVGMNPHYGTPKSVYDRETGRIPGGSSSGAAVSVADGMCALAIGTDTGGSCRIPAAFNGIVGYKPSTLRVPKDGVYPLSETLDSVGPFATSVACCAAADAIMAGDWDGRVGERAPSSIRLGIVRDVFFEDVEDEVASAFDAAVRALEAAGVSFADVRFKALNELAALNRRGGIAAAEAYAHHQDMIAKKGNLYDPWVRKRIEPGAAITASELIGIHKRRREMIAEADRLSEGLDGWIVPTTPLIPPAISAFDSLETFAPLNLRCLRNTLIGNFLDGCAISIPVSRPGEPPVGAMVMAPWGCDQRLFSVAGALEAAVNPRS